MIFGTSIPKETGHPMAI